MGHDRMPQHVYRLIVRSLSIHVMCPSLHSILLSTDRVPQSNTFMDIIVILCENTKTFAGGLLPEEKGREPPVPISIHKPDRELCVYN